MKCVLKEWLCQGLEVSQLRGIENKRRPLLSVRRLRDDHVGLGGGVVQLRQPLHLLAQLVEPLVVTHQGVQRRRRRNVPERRRVGRSRRHERLKGTSSVRLKPETHNSLYRSDS